MDVAQVNTTVVGNNRNIIELVIAAVKVNITIFDYDDSVFDFYITWNINTPAGYSNNGWCICCSSLSKKLRPITSSIDWICRRIE
ncbi:MAG: hypothetical protein HC785_05745 [Calothrix sp. CSU_2_0]|nr:hypothetical protein [Calothrix sp. CSU_2_0]